MNKQEIIKKRRELKDNLLSVYQLEKELTQEFLANHPNLVGTVLKYKTSHVTTFKKVTGILSYDSTLPKLILQCVIDKLTISDTQECITGTIEMIPFSHFDTHRTTNEDYEDAARAFIRELCQGPDIKITDEEIRFSSFDTAQAFNQFYFVLDPEATDPDATES